jgi:transcriptional regulator with XRE-family HTH domain
MDERVAIGQMLKQARVIGGISQGAAAEQAGEALGVGMKQQTWSMIEKGERALEVGELDAVASAVGLDRETLLREAARLTGRPTPAARPLQPSLLAQQDLLIRDRVQAGAWLAAEHLGWEEQKRFSALPDPRFPAAAQYIASVAGDSMNAVHIFDGDYAHLVDIGAIGYQPVTGNVVEVERTRFGGQLRELTLKQIEMTPQGPLLWPRSTNPNWAEPLDIRHGVPQEEDIQVTIRGLLLNVIRRF